MGSINLTRELKVKVCFANLSTEEAKSLEQPFWEEEVCLALKDMNGDKARGQMGSLWPFGRIHGALSKGFNETVC